MPDVGHPTPHDRPAPGGIPIAAALNALPLDAPPRSAWPAIAAAARLDPPRGAKGARWPYAFATAAALALALLLPVPGEGPADGSAAESMASRTASEGLLAPIDLPTLMQESARLERLIAAVNDDPLQPADALVLGLAFEDELADIDAALSTAPRGSRDAQDLWQQRVDILSRYAELQSSRRLLASAGQPYETTLVALH